MAAVAGIPPKDLCDVLLANGWKIIDETENVWLLVDSNDRKAPPLPLSKHGDEVDPEGMDWVAHRSPGLGRAVMGAVRKHVAKPPPPSTPPAPTTP